MGKLFKDDTGKSIKSQMESNSTTAHNDKAAELAEQKKMATALQGIANNEAASLQVANEAKNIANGVAAKVEASNNWVRKTSFSLTDLKKAVADQNLEKYGLKVGDETTINGYTYVIAGLNTMRGTSTPYRVNVPHVGLVVIPHATHAWNVSGNTYTGAGGRGAGYLNCDLHAYLKGTTLPHVQNDLGAANLIAHNKLLTNAVNTSGYNKFGAASGCSSGWTWSSEYICALSEVQVYGSAIWSSSGYDTGEACRQLEVFQKYSHTEIFKVEYPWLRDVASASYAAIATDYGYAYYNSASLGYFVAALILFH